MNNWEKSNLELTPAPEMTMLDENGTVTVLIKHDYYSSDTENGRSLLASFLDSLAECGSNISKVILIDSAVRLLNDDLFAPVIEKLFSLSKYSYVCEESLNVYETEYVSHGNIIVCPASDIAIEIFEADHLITLE
jgi:hypothetical protein